jgi:methyl-accepting chemotaxis protein
METRRSQTIIKSKFQQRLIIYVISIALITINVILMAAELLDTRFGSDTSLFSLFHVSVGLMEVVAVLIIYFVSRSISFRIAGPVYALERTIRGMGEGNLDQTLQLRTRDQFVEVADELNRTMHNYCERIHRAQALARQLDARESSEQSAALQRELDWFVTQSEVS